MKGMKNGYVSLAVQTAISGVIMYLVMFVMIDGLGSFYNNLNTFYMTLMMAAPMTMMVIGMKGMFPSTRLNVAIVTVSAIVFFGAFALIRTQTTIGDTAFLRSMIPHHSGAILMCQQAKLEDPEVKRLCGEIIKSQRSEIDEMKAILKRL